MADTLVPLAVALVGLTALTGCGNLMTVVDAGHLGVTVDGSGEPVITVMTCSSVTPVISLVEGRRDADPPNQPNPARGDWQAQDRFTGVRSLAPSAPGETWQTIRAATRLEADRLFVVTGGTVESADANLQQVSFRRSDLAGLTTDQVLVEDGTIDSMLDFAAYRCRN